MTESLGLGLSGPLQQAGRGLSFRPRPSQALSATASSLLLRIVSEQDSEASAFPEVSKQSGTLPPGYIAPSHPATPHPPTRTLPPLPPTRLHRTLPPAPSHLATPHHPTRLHCTLLPVYTAPSHLHPPTCTLLPAPSYPSMPHPPAWLHRTEWELHWPAFPRPQGWDLPQVRELGYR